MSAAAQAVRARSDPAIGYPPVVKRFTRDDLRNLQMIVAGKKYLIGPAVEGDPQIAGAIDSASTITIVLRDPKGDMAGLFADEQVLLTQGVTITLASVVYGLQSAAVDTSTGTLVTLVFEDQVATRLRQYTSYLAIPRAKFTRAQAVLRLIDEASGSPLAAIGYYIPELTDTQKVASAGVAASVNGPGTGSGSYTVKGVKATAAQRSVIDAILGAAQKKKASTRVMVATIMAATQESTMSTTAANSGHIGPFQQSATWGTAQQRTDPASATGLFLDQWSFIFGSTKVAPGNLSDDIEKVQVSGQGSLYAAWTDEATQTVNTWQATGQTTESIINEPYYFERGQKAGLQQSSWDASGNWADEVDWHRFADRNTLFFVSDDELRQQAPSVTVHGDESWLNAPPAFSWNPSRAVQECTLTVLAERWSGGIGACVEMAGGGPTNGRMIVTALSGSLVDPELVVTLGRPATKLPEPAPQTKEVSNSANFGGLFAACQAISDQNHPYLYGAGHGVPLKSIKPTDPLDCSSSVCLALFNAGFYAGPEAITSGELAASFGVAGPGQDWTVHANAIHTFIAFEGDVSFKRFDTVGPGLSGPHLRSSAPPETDTFTLRHISGH